MNRTRNMIYKPSEEARELFIYVVNNGDAYPHIQAIVNNLAKKLKKGVYDMKKAVDAYYHVACEESDRYHKDFGYRFTVTERFTAAVDMEEYYFDHVVEKKEEI